MSMKSKNYSYWKEVGGLYICKKCNYYLEEIKSICPKCGCNMFGSKLEMELFKKKVNNSKKDLTN